LVGGGGLYGQLGCQVSRNGMLGGGVLAPERFDWMSEAAS
jgi:hypothetical protein